MYKSVYFFYNTINSVFCIWQINGLSMVNKSQEDALVLLRSTKPGGTVQLVVSRQALKKSAPDNIVMVPTHPLYSFINMLMLYGSGYMQMMSLSLVVSHGIKLHVSDGVSLSYIICKYIKSHLTLKE